ncbi:MAG: radical SAM/SPASM domain-containing protein [Candidatus Krumholzibacteriota bacterium]
MRYPIDTVIAVTYRCQARCRMCSIWQIGEHTELPPEVYRKLPASIRDLNISGGEPFLRKDLDEIVRAVHDRLPRSRVVVSSNGLMGKKLIPRAMELVDIFPGVGFAFSLDGIGEMQDYMRGVEGAYENVLAVVRGLKREGVDNMRLAYTLTDENAEHMIRVFELAGELGVQFTMSVAHDSDFFFGEGKSPLGERGAGGFDSASLKKDFETIINSQLGTFSIKNWGRAFLNYGIYALAFEGRQLFSSRPGEDFFYMDPGGDIYPSVIHGHVMGNLAERAFDSLWNSPEAERAREESRAEKKLYWMGCMLRKALLEHRFSIGMWALKNKLTGLRL